jgi:hypothetical protein
VSAPIAIELAAKMLRYLDARKLGELIYERSTLIVVLAC